MKQTIKEGDLVRVPGKTGKTGSIRCYRHSLPQGSVCIVDFVWPWGDCEVKHPAGAYGQIIHNSVLKLAKQAMRKRDKYGARRG